MGNPFSYGRGVYGLIPPRCIHEHLETITATYRLHNPENPDAPYFSVAMKVQCQQCKVLFRFLGDNPMTPESPSEAMARKLGAWVSPEGDEIGALLSPMDEDDPLGAVPVAGRA